MSTYTRVTNFQKHSVFWPTLYNYSDLITAGAIFDRKNAGMAAYLHV